LEYKGLTDALCSCVDVVVVCVRQVGWSGGEEQTAAEAAAEEGCPWEAEKSRFFVTAEWVRG
jgi:hypothetical protein